MHTATELHVYNMYVANIKRYIRIEPQPELCMQARSQKLQLGGSFVQICGPF